MHRSRSIIAVLALVALTMPLLLGAADETAAEGVGSASTDLLAAELTVSDSDGLLSGVLGDVEGPLAELTELDPALLDGLDTALDLGLLEGATTATTRDTPDARALLSPLRIGEERPHDVEAGPGEEQSGEAVAPAPASTLLSQVGISAFGVSADAADDHAIATIDAVQASADALGLTGIGLDLADVTSEVTRTGASAQQSLTVDGLVIGLGDVLPPELLEALPLDTLLGLIEELDLADGDLRGQLEGLVDSIVADVDALGALDVGELDGVGEVDQTLLDDLEALLAIQSDLEDADLSGVIATLEATADDLANTLLEDGSLDDGLGILDLGDLTDEELTEVLDTDLSDLDLDSEIAELQAVLDLLGDADEYVDVPEECLADLSTTLGGLLEDAERLEGCIDEVLVLVQAAIDALIGDIAAQLGLEDVLGQLQGLVDDLLALDALLDTIYGLVDDIAATDLLTADTLGLEVAASADGEGGATTIACNLGGLEILGTALGDQSCADGSLGDDVDGLVAGALGDVESLLASLPGVSGVDGLRLDLLPVATEEVTTAEDGTVTARAHAVLLELVVPSVTIDPSQADDLLGDLLALDLSVLDDLVTVVDDLVAEAGLDAVLPAEELDELTATLDALVVEELGGTIDEVLAQIEGLVDGLDLDVLGISISTPSIRLLLDPESEATFTPASTHEPEPTEPADDPEPVSDDPELPKTGGGIALLGLLAMLGSVALRRTRG